MSAYPLGQQIKLSFSFADANGAAVDPATVTAEVRDPDGTVETLATSHDGTGAYSALYTATAAGDYKYRGEGSGTEYAVAAEGKFSVKAKWQAA